MPEMLKIFKIFKDFKTSDKADKIYYTRLSPNERLMIAETLRKEYEIRHYGTQQRFQRVFRIVKQA